MYQLVGNLYNHIFTITDNLAFVFVLTGFILNTLFKSYPEFNKIKLYKLNKELESEITKIKNNNDEGEASLKLNELYKKNGYSPSFNMAFGFILTVFYVFYFGIVLNIDKYINISELNKSFLWYTDITQKGFDLYLPIIISLISVIALNMGKPLEMLRKEVGNMIVSFISSLVVFALLSLITTKLYFVFFLGIMLSKLMIAFILIPARRKLLKM